ncbi:MAG: hypothetical protein KDK39_12020 [Leptospiraceae bacterium]|nr:hypothetical protein [Leptospiraceae bacterium]
MRSAPGGFILRMCRNKLDDKEERFLLAHGLAGFSFGSIDLPRCRGIYNSINAAHRVPWKKAAQYGNKANKSQL